MKNLEAMNVRFEEKITKLEGEKAQLLSKFSALYEKSKYFSDHINQMADRHKTLKMRAKDIIENGEEMKELFDEHQSAEADARDAALTALQKNEAFRKGGMPYLTCIS